MAAVSESLIDYKNVDYKKLRKPIVDFIKYMGGPERFTMENIGNITDCEGIKLRSRALGSMGTDLKDRLPEVTPRVY